MATLQIGDFAEHVSFEEFIGSPDEITAHLHEGVNRRVVGVIVSDPPSTIADPNPSYLRWIICYARMSR